MTPHIVYDIKGKSPAGEGEFRLGRDNISELTTRLTASARARIGEDPFPRSKRFGHSGSGAARIVPR